MHWRARLLLAAEAFVMTIALGTLGMWCSMPNTARLADENPTSTAFIDLRRAEAEAAGKPFKLQWRWRPLGKISRYLRAAVVFSEDIHFYTHDGVDWDAIENAVEKDLNGARIGGSTITQQLAKNLYLSPRRSMLRKLREMLIAFRLEDHLTKQRILELYLNVIEWGDGVFGAEAAARKWYGRSAQNLTPAQAARLAIALPNPITRAPDVKDAELTKKAVRIIRLFRMEGLIDAAQEREALDEVGAPDEKVLPDREKPEPETATATATATGIAAEPKPVPDHGPGDGSGSGSGSGSASGSAEPTGPVTSPSETPPPPP